MEERFSVQEFCKEAASLLLMAYLFVLFFMYPFYMKDGYVEIGQSKFIFYRDITVGAFFLIIPPALIRTLIGWHKKKRTWLERVCDLSITDSMILLYAAGVILSYLFSDFKQEALWGEKGWNMGLVTQLLFVVTYFLLTRYWEYNEKILLSFAASSGCVFVLGILNRFSIHPLQIDGANSSFLSTLGNINWYCGYWAIAFGAGAFWYWVSAKGLERILSGVFVVIAAATGVSQGSNSAFISLGAVLFLVFCLSFRSHVRMRRFLEIAAYICISCQGLRIFRLWGEDRFDYYKGTISDRITLSPVTLYILAGIVLVYLMMEVIVRRKKEKLHSVKMIRQAVILLFFVSFGVLVILFIVNSRLEGGLRSLGKQQSLIYSEQWGSSRGGTWSAGVNSIRNMSPAKRLVGAGPDCFAMYIYSVEHIQEVVSDQFGDARLTNSHNEWLTVLVNNGLIGFAGYIGFFVTACYRFLRQSEKYGGGRRVYLYLIAGAMFSYILHNMVSFQQILSTPFIFMLAGMGERLLREEKEE